MHTLIHSLWAIEVARHFAVDFLLKSVGSLFHKLVDKAMDALGINALLALISQTERTIKLLGIISLTLAGVIFGIYLGRRALTQRVA
jgi:hypothetical protein